MPEIEIRPAVLEDMPYLEKIEHSYQSLIVWQMDRILQDGQITINFRQTRLPRPVRADYAGSHPVCERAYLVQLPGGFGRDNYKISGGLYWAF